MKISIISICYNSSGVIERTIKSVIDQSYKNIEYIVIDGGSNDGTLEIINQYRDQIDVLISEKDLGIYDAFNKGIRNSSGDLVTFLNSGDYYLSDYCWEVINNFDPSYSFICSNVLYFNDEYSKIVRPLYPKTKLGKPPFLHPALMVRRELFAEIGYFNLEFKTFSDFDWMLKLVNRKILGRYLDVTKVCFELQGASSKFLVNEYISVLIDNKYNFLQIFLCTFNYMLFHFRLQFRRI
jgi:glycosyltransferase involved in cell wall biosynthesis